MLLKVFYETQSGIIQVNTFFFFLNQFMFNMIDDNNNMFYEKLLVVNLLNVL